MRGERQLLTDVVNRLREEGLIDTSPGDVDTAIGAMADVQPWFVRTMVGFGAWLASLLLIGFVGSIGFGFEWGFALFGLGFMAGAVVVRRQSDTDFMIQSSLAASLAGQALFVFGVMEAANWDLPELIFVMILVINLVLFVIFPDRIHRVLSVMLAIGSLTVLFYMWKWNAAVPLLGPAIATALIALQRSRSALIASGKGDFYRPLQSGLMLSAFGCLTMSTVYVLPELGETFAFYPRPWISTLLLGGLLLHVARDAWTELLANAAQSTVVAIYGLLIIVIACAWLAPGLLLALIVILLGAPSGHRTMMGAGVGFLVIFLGTYFYGIQITMLQKSATLIASGAAILIARWIILRLLPEEASHA